MLDNTLTVDYGATTGIALKKVDQSNFSSIYFGEAADMKLTLSVKHTIPARGQSGENHLVRLDVEHYDTEGVYLRTSSAWTVLKTWDGTQDSSATEDTHGALAMVTTNATNLAKIINRES